MWQHIQFQLRQLRANSHLGDILDVLIIAAILYFSMLWFRRRASRAVLTATGSVITLYALARVLNMYLTSMLFTAGLAAALVAVVIIFQSDIRRSFELIASLRLFTGHRHVSNPLPDMVDTLVSAIAELAESRTGVLVVLQGRQSLEHHTRGGVAVHGALSHPLLCSIFDHHSPGHDGAVLIDQGRIEKLGVILPLSHNLDKAAGHGTRHAAALGLSEQSDALVIVASEERGSISVTQNGRLAPIRSAAILKQRVEAFYRETFPPPGSHQRWRWLHGHLGLKTVSLALACVLWLLFAYRVETVYRTLDVAIEYRNMPPGVVIEDSLPVRARVTLSGSERDFTMGGKIPPISINLAKLKSSTRFIEISEKHLSLPTGLQLERVEPEQIVLHVPVRTTTRVPIRLRTQGHTARGIHITAITLVPDSISIHLSPSTRTDTLPQVCTEPLDLTQITASTLRTIRLEPPAGISLAKPDSTVRVRVEVQTVD